VYILIIVVLVQCKSSYFNMKLQLLKLYAIFTNKECSCTHILPNSDGIVALVKIAKQIIEP